MSRQLRAVGNMTACPMHQDADGCRWQQCVCSPVRVLKLKTQIQELTVQVTTLTTQKGVHAETDKTFLL